MQKFIIRLMLLLIVGLLGIVSLAQDSLLININESDTFITIPADWQDETSDDGVLTVSNESVSLMVYTAATLEELFEIEAAETPEEQLEAVIEELPLGDDAEFDVDEIDTVTIDERDAANLTFATEEARGTVTALTLDDESIAIIVQTISGVPPIGITETIEDMLESLNAAADSSSKAATDSDADTDTATSAAACFVSTPDTNTVQIRVGPGTNRTVIAFLPALVDFEALGQTTDDAGNVWFRVPQEEAAPTKAVNETWVLADAVDQSGDCANVVDAAAPPIIPIRQAQPTAVPQVDTATDTSGGETTAPEAPAAPAVDASGAIIPEQGTWFMQFNTGTIRCGSVTSQANPANGSITATLTGGGSAGFVFDDLFFQYNGGNTYQSSAVFSTSSGSELVQVLTLTMTSSRTATGNIGFVEGSCTVNAPITLNFIG